MRHSFVMRQGQALPVDFYRLLREGDTSQNIFLQADDFVYVPSASAQQVYVLGAVSFPRAMAYTEGMTLVSAIAGASGASNGGLAYAHLVRRRSGRLFVARGDCPRIAGAAADDGGGLRGDH